MTSHITYVCIVPMREIHLNSFQLNEWMYFYSLIYVVESISTELLTQFIPIDVGNWIHSKKNSIRSFDIPDKLRIPHTRFMLIEVCIWNIQENRLSDTGTFKSDVVWKMENPCPI